MRLSTRTKATFAIATVASMIGAVAWAQNLGVRGNAWFGTGGSGNVGIGTATPNSKLQVVGPITMTSPDSVNIYGLTLQRTNENGRRHEWKWWHMNTSYGQDSLHLYEYQTDSAGLTCTGNTADGAMCAPGLTAAATCCTFLNDFGDCLGVIYGNTPIGRLVDY